MIVTADASNPLDAQQVGYTEDAVTPPKSHVDIHNKISAEEVLDKMNTMLNPEKVLDDLEEKLNLSDPETLLSEIVKLKEEYKQSIVSILENDEVDINEVVGDMSYIGRKTLAMVCYLCATFDFLFSLCSGSDKLNVYNELANQSDYINEKLNVMTDAQSNSNRSMLTRQQRVDEIDNFSPASMTVTLRPALVRQATVNIRDDISNNLKDLIIERAKLKAEPISKIRDPNVGAIKTFFAKAQLINTLNSMNKKHDDLLRE